MKQQVSDPAAAELAALAGEAQARFAAGLLTPKTRRDTLRAALAVLQRAPLAEARPALRALLEHFSAHGGALDYGGYARADSLRALRPFATQDDVALLLHCANTYEFPPPAFAEEAALLRAGALVVLAEVDESLARLEAARLLVDAFTDPMSGEPARSAAQCLAAFGDRMPLYQFACDARHLEQAEVVAECLRGLESLPSVLLARLTERFGKQSPAVVQVGLIDLLLRHKEGGAHTHALIELLRTASPEVARYLVFAVVASAREEMIAALVEALRFEKPARLDTLRDALELARHIPAVAALLDRSTLPTRGTERGTGRRR